MSRRPNRRNAERGKRERQGLTGGAKPAKVLEGIFRGRFRVSLGSERASACHYRETRGGREWKREVYAGA